MNFSEWLKANGYDESALTPANRKHLEAAWKTETAPPPLPPVPDPKPDATVEDKLSIYEAESERVAAITAQVEAWAAANPRATPEKMKQLRELRETAITDQKTSPKDFTLAMFRFDRTVGPMILTPREQAVNGDVVEAAVCMAGGLENIDKHYSDQVLSTAHKQFRHGLGLHGLILHCAKRNGYTGYDVKSNWYSAVKAGFGGGEMYASTTGPSTYSLPNILANIANKFLRVGFMAVDQTWSSISATRSVADFKTATTAALTGAMQYNKLPPSGEIKHATVSETVYTNKADTYGVMLGIDRQSLINDDLGALTTAGRRMGRGAALKLNDIFWTVFLNNSAFFAAGNNNVSTGGGSALGTADGAAINAAEVKFLNQTDPDGKPMATMPTIMLVPPTLKNTAARWMGSQLFTPSGTTGLGATNIFGGRYTVASSPYMENASYTGNSTAAWYLLADPNDVPVIEVAFLNGNQQPTVETEAAEFNMLGIAMRGYWDFGVSLQEFRGGVRSAGS